METRCDKSQVSEGEALDTTFIVTGNVYSFTAVTAMFWYGRQERQLCVTKEKDVLSA